MSKENFGVNDYLLHLIVFISVTIAISSCSKDDMEKGVNEQDSILFVNSFESDDSSIIYLPAEKLTITAAGTQVYKRSLSNRNHRYFEKFNIWVINGNNTNTMVPGLELLMDGKVILVSSDFKGNTNATTKTLERMKPSSELEIRLSGLAGQFIIIQIECKLQPDVITDIDSNYYHTVKIGNDLWMSENLRVSRYNDGTHLDYLTEGSIWNDMYYANQGYYAWYNDDVANKEVYGALYNIYAVTPQNNDHNICPEGWHVASFVDFWDMVTILEPGVKYVEEVFIAGGMMKEEGTEHWDRPNSGATNATGFTALPAGVRYETFSGLGEYGSWWLGYGEGFRLQHESTGVNYWYDEYDGGHSIRCVKDGAIKFDIIRPFRNQLQK